MDYRCEIFRSIEEVDREEWNQLRRDDDDLYMDPRFIRAVENSMSGDTAFQHVLLRDARGRPTASACLSSYLVDFTLFAGKGMKWLARAARRLVTAKVLFCGLPVSAGQSNVRMAPHADAPRVLRMLDELARDFATQHKAPVVVFKEFGAEQCPVLGELALLGYRNADSLPMNHVRIRCNSFDEFCSQLRSHKRYTIQRSRKKFGASGLRVLQLTGADGAAAMYTDEVHRLYDAVLDRATVKLERLPAAFFRELACQLPENTVFTFVLDGRRVAGFAASAFMGDSYHQMFIGFDYELNPQTDLYFNLFYNALDYGLRHRFKHFYFGQTSDTFKSQKLGCTQQPLTLYVKALRPAARLILWLGFDTIFPSQTGALSPANAARTATQQTQPPKNSLAQGAAARTGWASHTDRGYRH
jgi:predicted N-acyltransferase